MDIWLPFHHAGRDQVLHILTNVGQLQPPEYDGSSPNPSPLVETLARRVEGEWARVPGRHVQDLTADHLIPLAEVTKRFKELVFSDNDRNTVLDLVERVIPALEGRRDGGYDGPGEDVRDVVNELLEKLRSPTHSASRRSTFWLR